MEKRGNIIMLDIKDIRHMPDIEEIEKYIGNLLFVQFFQYMKDEYKALCKIEYSKDVYAQGWNVKLRKAGKGLCTIYPKEGYFTILVVVGKKEKAKAEEKLPTFSKKMQEIYQTTKEGNGQRWLMYDLREADDLYQDTLQLIRIRRESK